jgi:2-aminoadipate transaminase
MPSFQPQFADRTKGVNPSVIREILKVVSRPDIISFAGGMPAPELFPVEELKEATQQVYQDAYWLPALQYGPSEGYRPLREWILADLEKTGVKATLEDILITTGSQQGIDLFARVMLNPGDKVIVSNPTFLGAIQTFNAFQASYLTVGMDDEGMIVEEVESLLAAHKVKFIYAIPTFQNPTGASMSEARKQKLYDVARHYGVPILEDDPYGELYFGDTMPTTLKTYDLDNKGVVLLRTFSKTLAPSLRVAYLVAPKTIMSQIITAKQVADLHTSGFNQVVVERFLSAGHLEPHLDTLRTVYKKRCDLMLGLMKTHFPKDLKWTVPTGGLFTWVEMPTGYQNTTTLLGEALNLKVAFIPGSPFFAEGGGEHTFRLNFSNASEASIEEGIMRLGGLLKEVQKNAAPVVV